MKKIYVCSKYKGNTETNLKNARKYCRIVYELGFLPVAPHLYFTQFLDDNVETERNFAMQINKQLIDFCDELWIFSSEVSSGMQFEIDYAISIGKTIKRSMWGD